MSEVIQSNPNIMGGTPVFRGTRVPVQTLFDYVEGGETITEFLDDFPSVSREHVIKLLSDVAAELSAGMKAACASRSERPTAKTRAALNRSSEFEGPNPWSRIHFSSR
jgi:uncharacterized protein (DUF433 family)